MIKILAIIPAPTGAVSFYRGLGPLLRLQKDHPDFIQVSYGASDYQWCDLYPFDIIFLIRPDTPDGVNLIHRARRMNKRIWTDWDDLLWEIPIHHPLSPRYTDPKVLKTIAEAMSLSDATSFSTPYLESRAQEDFGITGTRLITNAVDFEMQPAARKYQGGHNYMWRGSNTHEHDLYIYKEAIIHSVLKHDRAIHFYGSMPHFIFTAIPNFQQYPFTELPEYLENIRVGKYSMALVPLGPDNFNKAKSNIAALEAVTAGIIPVVPSSEGWADIGIPYTGIKNMMEAIDFLEGESQESLSQHWSQMMAVVKKEYDIKTQNAVRKSIIKDLVSWVEQ